MILYNNLSKIKKLQHIVAIFFIFLTLSSLSYLAFQKLYSNKIYPRTQIAGIEVGGMTTAEAQEKLALVVNNIDEKGIVFQYKDKSATIFPVVASFEGGIAFPVILFNVENTVETVQALGRNDNFFKNILFNLKTLLYGRNISLSINTEDEIIQKILEENYQKLEQKAKDATLVATSTVSQYNQVETKFIIEEERIGFTIDYKKSIANLKNKLSMLDTSTIYLEASQDFPSIYKAGTLNIENEAQKIISKGPINLNYEDKQWPIEKSILADWLFLKKGIEDRIVIGLNQEKIEKFLEENIAIEINQKPIDAKFEIKGDRVVEFQSSKSGIKLNPLKSISIIETDFLLGTSTDLMLVVETEESAVKTENLNNLGIKEIIGTGHSNFAGSPSNRIHNIITGAKAVAGTLIKPGEEFSLITVLGDIDKENGYLPELVIKGNRTIPEYGGGLCQIGTTVFRAALQSGLEITARRNHSYRVSYYEPAGTDATIYDPWPDFKFRNNTANHILIQYRIDGNDLYFDFWGTKDERIIEITDPVIYNITSPGPTKIIETTDLPPGVKKCTESAHNGADAYFDYTVTLPGEEPQYERFSSHYVPWQAVCLVGVEEISENKIDAETKTDTPTSTAETTI